MHEIGKIDLVLGGQIEKLGVKNIVERGAVIERSALAFGVQSNALQKPDPSQAEPTGGDRVEQSDAAHLEPVAFEAFLEELVPYAKANDHMAIVQTGHQTSGDQFVCQTSLDQTVGEQIRFVYRYVLYRFFRFHRGSRRTVVSSSTFGKLFFRLLSVDRVQH